jgi:hypothetical protein
VINWQSGIKVTLEGDDTPLSSSNIEVEKLDKDSYQVFFNVDIINRIIVNLNKKECEELGEKLKEIVKD